MSTLKLDYLEAGHGTDITINSGTTLIGTAIQFKITGGTAGQALITDGSGGISFGTVDALPTQATNVGKFLTTDGTNASWATVDALPSQSGQAGEFLTTNGTNASWATVDALPSQTGQAGEFLTTDGTSADWISDAGQIETPGNYYKNYNEITVNTTTTVPTTENGIVFGPINSTAEWTINGTLVIL